MNESIEFLLRAVNRRAEKLANQELAKFDLTSTQFRTLTYLSHQPPLTVRQCDLEVFFSKSNPAVTGILNNMEQKNLIRRVCNPLTAAARFWRSPRRVWLCCPSWMPTGAGWISCSPKI